MRSVYSVFLDPVQSTGWPNFVVIVVFLKLQEIEAQSNNKNNVNKRHLLYIIVVNQHN